MSTESSQNNPRTENAPASERATKRSRWRRILLVSLGVLVGLGIIVRLAAPEVLRRTAISQSPKFINGHIDLEDINLSVFMGRIELDDLVVYSDKAPEAPLLKMQKLAVQIGWGALFEGRIHVKNILLDKPEVDVAVNAEGRLNWENLALQSKENPKEETSEEDSQLAVRIDGATVQNAQLQFTDARKGTIPPVRANLGSIQIAGFDLTHDTSEEPSPEGGGLEWGATRLDLSDWRIGLEPEQGKPVELLLTLHSEGLEGTSNQFPLQVEIESDAGRIQLDAKVAVSPPSFKGTLTWTELALPRLLELVPIEDVKLDSGKSEGKLEISFDSREPKAESDEPQGNATLELSVTGKLGVDTLDLEVTGPSPLTAEWETLNVGVKKISISPIGSEDGHPPVIDAELSNVALTKPNFEFVLTERASTTSGNSDPPAPVPSGTPHPPAQQDTAANPVTVRLATLNVSDGSLRFEDHTLDPPFKYNVGELKVTATDLEWPAAIVSKLDLSLAAGGIRPVTLTGRQGAESGRFKLEMHEVPLLPFNPYTHKMGVLLTQGTLSVNSELALRGLKYNANNDLAFNSLAGRSIGDTFTSYFGVPLGIAITLLEDPFDKINLAVPFKGEGDHGGLQLMNATGTAFRRSLTNALATPIKMLAATALPKSDASRLTFTLVPFGPGEAKLSDFAIGQLENYAQVLASTGHFHANLWPQISFGDARREVPDFKWTPGEKKGRIDPDHPGYAKLMALANSRANAVSAQLETQLAVPERKIQVTTWTGDLIGGPAGVRIGFSDGKLEHGLLERATDRLKKLF